MNRAALFAMLAAAGAMAPAIGNAPPMSDPDPPPPSPPDPVSPEEVAQHERKMVLWREEADKKDLERSFRAQEDKEAQRLASLRGVEKFQKAEAKRERIRLRNIALAQRNGQEPSGGEAASISSIEEES